SVFVGSGVFGDVGITCKVGRVGGVRVGRFVDVMATVGEMASSVCVDDISAVCAITVEASANVGVGVPPVGPMIPGKARMQMHATHEIKITPAITHLFRFIANALYTND